MTTLLDHVLVINLDRRADRLSRFTVRAYELGIEFTRFPAIDGMTLPPEDVELYIASVPRMGKVRAPGALGLVRSFAAAIEFAQERGWPHVAVLEDDCEFVPNVIETLTIIEQELPPTWHTLRLGGSWSEKDPPFMQHVSPHLVKLGLGVWLTHAQIWHERAYEGMLGMFKTELDVADRLTQWYAVQCGEEYLTQPLLAHQTVGDFSDIYNRRVYSKLDP